MAKIEIESAFVEPWNRNQEQHPSWGMKVAEPHGKKGETTGRTFRTVKVSRASGIDLSVFSKGARVAVVGREVTETREHEGKKFYDLIVWADRVELAGGSANAPAPSSAESADVWATPAAYTDETPF